MSADRWTAHVDIEDAKTFYHDKLTGLSTWTLPVGVERPLSAQ